MWHVITIASQVEVTAGQREREGANEIGRKYAVVSFDVLLSNIALSYPNYA
jgi:hypothetical protein